MFFVVLAVFLLVFCFSFSAWGETAGCYVFPEADEDLYCVPGLLDTAAQLDCKDYPSCNLNEYFIPNSDCSEIPECAEITCNVDCQTHTKGKCTQLGGEKVPEEQYPEWCDPGCCKIEGTSFCEFNLNLYECKDRAKKLGIFNQLSIIFDNVNMNTEKCIQTYCPVEVKKASLSGYILDQNLVGLAGAKVFFEGRDIPTQITDGSGKYTFPTLNPGQYLIKATLEGYLPSSLSLSLSSGAVLKKDLTLIKAEGNAQVQGIVKDKDGLGLKEAAISWTGPVNGQVYANEEGKYSIDKLPAGKYVFTASKVGLVSVKQEKTLPAGTTILDFLLEEIVFEGITGRTYIDLNPADGLFEEEEARYGVKIYLNSVFKGCSQYPSADYELGEYRLALSPAGEEQEYEITAVYEDYKLSKKFKLKPGQSITNYHLLLTKYVGECTAPNPPKAVENFVVNPVRGKKQVVLKWVKPCPEVRSYLITKIKDAVEVGHFKFSPAENSWIDTEVEWGKTYTYKIIALYDEDISENVVSATITLGNKLCEGKYFEKTGWDLFCAAGEGLPKKVWTCNDQNQLAVSKDCSLYDTPYYFCAKTSEHRADCKTSGVCGSQAQQADPFGLYYSKSSCYGPASPEQGGAANFCYYDSTNSVVDSCYPCDKLKSCFDYKSEDACKINNCLSSKCTWVNGAASNLLINYHNLFPGLNIPLLVTPETGAGYCVEADYNQDDKCSLCGPESKLGLFKNYFCTAEVCSALGRCFTNSVIKEAPLQSCAACGDKPSSEINCYTYQFESECTGGQNLEKNNREEITLSKDRCGWQRCVWLGKAKGQGSCVKDGDGDLKDDCTQVPVGEIKSCMRDNAPPRTTLVSGGLNILSLTKTNLTFQAVDKENQLGVAGFCLTSANPKSPGICTEFIEQPYPGKLKDETLTINFLNTKYLQQPIPGETYVLKYYSKDKYFNQEQVQSAFVYIDNVPPQFELNQQLETTGDVTDLTVYLEGTSEPMSCSFKLEQILPAGETISKQLSQEVERKEISFTGLQGIKFQLTVTCKDSYGNENIKEKLYTFDLEERIEIISPELYGAVSSTDPLFKVKTISGASCGLYLAIDNSKVAEFVSNEEGKVHETPPISGLIEKEYAGEYKVVCKELFGEASYEDFFHFTVDFTAPQTQIILKEGGREVKPIKFNWEEYFIEKVALSFECTTTGFACDKTFYCFGEECEFFKKTDYQEFSKEILLENSTKVCYYSTDKAKNPVYRPSCGKIIIEGYGITLEKPSLYYYLDEAWGVSNANNFTWQFFTKIPTAKCKFDFGPGFDYKQVPPYKTKEPNEEKKYIFAEFPSSVFSEYPEKGGTKAVYVKCENIAGEISPEQKFNLEFDPTAPQINQAYAEPDNIFEEIRTTLFVETDDKTQCKYSDDSEQKGSIEYETMEFSFPGIKDQQLNTLHQTDYAINFLGAEKEYSFKVMCKNGAGNLSKLEEINFKVDYSAVGNIKSISPNGFIREKNVTLAVEALKKAVCKYKFGKDVFEPFSKGANTNFHTVYLGNLEEKKEYIIPIKCTMGEHTVEAKATFKIDFTPPTIASINDGTSTCGGKEVNVLVYTNEENLSGYYYEVYSQGSVKNLTTTNLKLTIPANLSNSYYSQYVTNLNKSDQSPISGEKVYAASIGPGLPINISTASLKENNQYSLRIKAIDAAGNEGKFATSDGFMVTSRNVSSCKDTGAPEILMIGNDTSCTSTLVELHCLDGTNCKIKYGIAASATLCNATLAYNGQKLMVTKTSWLCYSAIDSAGNNYTKSQIIVFKDNDGDGISDRCDKCANTGAGKIADTLGCAPGEVPESETKIDSDKDGLPDVWEKTYDEFGCGLDYQKADSDGNGVDDSLEDYDRDGLSNYEEYVKQLNPCVADAPQKETEPETEGPSATKTNLFAWIFLILGVLLVLGGIGYLVYYYQFSTNSKGISQKSTGTRFTSFIKSAEAGARGVLSDWERKLLELRKARKEKARLQERSSVFGTFSQQSKNIPHVDKLLKQKAPHLTRLGDLAQKYAEHKNEIKPGLRAEEKNIFTKLENIARKTKDKNIQEVVSKEEAKDIFGELRKLSKKRKV